MGLEFLNKHNIIHRDIKPENLVFDEFGYLRITDFGIGRYLKPENSADTSGTPGYMGMILSPINNKISSGSYVSTKPWICSRLLCVRSHCL